MTTGEPTPQIEVVVGDITTIKADIIVNAANSSLMVGGGVDGAIHRAAGIELEREARSKYGSCATGSAVITRGYNLPAEYVIHAVGPRYHDGKRGEADLLASCYLRSLELANDYGATSIAYPSISTGIYGYPKRMAAEVAVGSIREYLSLHPESSLLRIMLVAFSPEDAAALREALAGS